MKLAVLAVSLLVAAIAAVGSLVSHGSHTGGVNDAIVQELSQKVQEQDAKLSKAEEALRQLQNPSSAVDLPLPSGMPSPSAQAASLRTQFQWVSKEETRLGVIHQRMQQEQQRLDALRKQLELTKYRLDQEEKVLGLEVIAKAVDERNLAKPAVVQMAAVTAVSPTSSRLVDLHGETPFEFPQPLVAKPVDYASLNERQAQLQTERKQWATQTQNFNQMQAILNRQMASYRKDFSALVQTKNGLDQEWNTLKNQGLGLKAKS